MSKSYWSMMGLSVAATVFATGAIAQDNECHAERSVMERNIQKYQGIYDGYSKEGDDIKNDAVVLDGTVKWANTEVIFDTPTVTMKDQKLIFGVPQTTVKDRDIIFHTPSTRMERVKTGQYPETFCEDTWISLPFGGRTKGIPKCTVRWSNIYMDVPTTFMQEQRIRMGIPEFRWDDTSVVMGVPEFSLQRQKWIIGVPQFTVTSVVINPGPIQDRSDALQNRIAETKKNQQREMTSDLSGVFGCHRTSLAEKRSQTVKMFELSIAQLDSVISSLQSQGADPSSIAGADGKKTDLFAKRLELITKRDESLAIFDKSIETLNKSEIEAIAKLQS